MRDVWLHSLLKHAFAFRSILNVVAVDHLVFCSLFADLCRFGDYWLYPSLAFVSIVVSSFVVTDVFIIGEVCAFEGRVTTGPIAFRLPYCVAKISLFVTNVKQGLSQLRSPSTTSWSFQSAYLFQPLLKKDRFRFSTFPRQQYSVGGAWGVGTQPHPSGTTTKAQLQRKEENGQLAVPHRLCVLPF